jgi:hypothetical protein
MSFGVSLYEAFLWWLGASAFGLVLGYIFLKPWRKNKDWYKLWVYIPKLFKDNI